ncbi:hypothetical protein DPSP01_004862 [Paraphaeosphaeria sporulosa]|uniref:ABC transporter domain-containing protein n=1 Tax=Paraphaeosphaeria sporulosa TaxID=1460663 RepID=A0A177CPD0_9PLEO|nr:uncharacterized protein CC84DRAFT_1174440 [Paraphaeosphaeria sporulosa]OAG09071.1 hypothetical protein CC84DRAFT_1174440 [Paraphaeosphaeria sporulosa]
MDPRQDDNKNKKPSESVPTSIDSAEATSLPTEVPAEGMLMPNGKYYTNFSTLESAGSYRTLNSSTTGCYAENGSMPILLAEKDDCNLGFFCPNSTDNAPPQYCPPSFQCQALRMTGKDCPPQGLLEPVVCQGGYYCPKGGKEKIECPKGSYCPFGSFEPWPCAYGAICPAKSQRQIVTMPFGFMIAFDIVLGIIVGLGFFISAWRKGRKKNYAALPNPEKDMDDDGIELIAKGNKEAAEDHDDLSANPDFQVFMRYISRLIKTKDVGLSFDFEGLEFEPQPGKKILKGVSGSIQSGSMWAVMGGSGAGKSTFFNVLMGKTRHTGGLIKVNGHPKDMAKYKKLIGFVPQDDIVIPELTVRENILHSARCRLPMTWKDRDIQAYVDALISCIGLSHVQHSLVGDANKPVVSGGQRKRVSIGMELAAAPMCIFLDEPTSGLDATSASSIMRLLKAITKLGVTTITIIHQPREQIFNGFDNILLLGLGSEIYAGPTAEAPVYFDSLGFTFPPRANPADVIMDIINGEGFEYRQDHATSETPVTRLIENWRTRHQREAPAYHAPQPQHLLPEDAYNQPAYDPPEQSYQDALAAPKRPRPVSMISTADQEAELKRTMKKRGASWYAQTYYCCKRSITQQVRLKNSFFFEIGTGAFAGGIIGLSAFTAEGELFKGIYHDSFSMLSHATNYTSAPQLGLLGAMAIGLAASAPAVKVFGEEKLIFNREASSGHSMSAYYVGKMVSVLPRLFIAALHFSVFMGILATPIMSWVDMFVANLLYFFCVYGLASCIGMVVKREDGPLLAVMASLIIGILGGVAPPLSKVKEWKIEFLWRMSPGVWFTESYFSQCLLPLDYLYMLDQAKVATGFNLGKFSLDMGVLVALGVVYRVIAFVLLVTVQRKRG